MILEIIKKKATTFPLITHRFLWIDRVGYHSLKKIKHFLNLFKIADTWPFLLVAKSTFVYWPLQIKAGWRINYNIFIIKNIIINTIHSEALKGRHLSSTWKTRYISIFKASLLKPIHFSACTLFTPTLCLFTLVSLLPESLSSWGCSASSFICI